MRAGFSLSGFVFGALGLAAAPTVLEASTFYDIAYDVEFSDVTYAVWYYETADGQFCDVFFGSSDPDCLTSSDFEVVNPNPSEAEMATLFTGGPAFNPGTTYSGQVSIEVDSNEMVQSLSCIGAFVKCEFREKSMDRATFIDGVFDFAWFSTGDSGFGWKLDTGIGTGSAYLTNDDFYEFSDDNYPRIRIVAPEALYSFTNVRLIEPLPGCIPSDFTPPKCDDPSVIPLPASLPLLGIGLLGIGWLSRRRQTG